MPTDIGVDAFVVLVEGGRGARLDPSGARSWFGQASKLLLGMADVTLTVKSGPTALTYPKGTKLERGADTPSLAAVLFGSHGLPRTDGTFPPRNADGDRSVHVKAFFVPHSELRPTGAGKWEKPLVEGKRLISHAIAVEDDVPADRMPWVIAHELGHVLLGGGHEPGGQAGFLMSRTVPTIGPRVTPAQARIMAANAGRLASGSLPEYGADAGLK